MELLTIQETAKQLKLPTATVRRYIATGRLPAVQIGGHIRVREESLEQALQPVRPVRLRHKRRYRRVRRTWAGDPLWNIVGMFASGEPEDISLNKDAYLAEAALPNSK